MTLDELIDLTGQGPAIVMMSREDMLNILTRLKISELQVAAYRKQELYQAGRQQRQKDIAK